MDEDEIIYECAEDYCECGRIPFWKILLFGWLFLT